MNTRQLTFLLAPSIVVAAFSMLLLFEYTLSKQFWQATIENQPSFEKFIGDVKSGKRQMTTGLWIDRLGAAENWAESERTIIVNNADGLRISAAGGLLIALLHIWVVFSIRKDLLKR